MKTLLLSCVATAALFSPVASFQPPTTRGTTSHRLVQQRMNLEHVSFHQKQHDPSEYRRIISGVQQPSSSETTCRYMGPSGSESNTEASYDPNDGPNWTKFVGLCTAGVLYWYLMVFGAAAQSNGLPVPDWLPLTPGWPATETDLAPVIEDSYHFFYLSEVLGNTEAPSVSPPRLGVFNLDEAWILAMLPALWRDERRRLSRPILFGSWLVLGINLTNAFLLPYLALTELRSNPTTSSSSTTTTTTSAASLEEEEDTRSTVREVVVVTKNRWVAAGIGGVATAVVGYAALQCGLVATSEDWTTFWVQVQTDRTYLAFVVDSLVFSIVQPLILERVRSSEEQQPFRDYIPFVGLIAWLFEGEE